MLKPRITLTPQWSSKPVDSAIPSVRILVNDNDVEYTHRWRLSCWTDCWIESTSPYFPCVIDTDCCWRTQQLLGAFFTGNGHSLIVSNLIWHHQSRWHSISCGSCEFLSCQVASSQRKEVVREVLVASFLTSIVIGWIKCHPLYIKFKLYQGECELIMTT